MKKILFSVLVFFISQSTYSQIIDSFGLKIGYSYSNIDYKLNNLPFDFESDYKPGFVFSIYGKKTLSKNIEFISEIGYSQKGFREEFFRSDESGLIIGMTTFNNSFDYLTLQVYPRLIINLGLIEPYILAGPKLDILLSSDFEFHLFDHSEYMTKSQIGLVYGFGAKLEKMIHIPLLVEVISFYDFTSYAENDNFESRNISYQLKLGLEL